MKFKNEKQTDKFDIKASNKNAGNKVLSQIMKRTKLVIGILVTIE